MLVWPRGPVGERDVMKAFPRRLSCLLLGIQDLALFLEYINPLINICRRAGGREEGGGPVAERQSPSTELTVLKGLGVCQGRASHSASTKGLWSKAWELTY